MIGRLYLHIGPPKTATTALQIALQSLDIPGFAYLGAEQPRQKLNPPPSHVLHQIAKGSIAQNELSAKELRNLIVDRLKENKIVVISEEMFLVWQKESNFIDKLLRTFSFLDGLPITILLTVRDPKFAIPSYYQEVFQDLPLKLQKSLPDFARDIRASCFDYRTVSACIEHNAIAVRYLDFKDITSAPIEFSSLFGLGCGVSATFSIPKANASQKSHSGIRVMPVVSSRIPTTNSFALKIGQVLTKNLITRWHFLTRLFDKTLVEHPSMITEKSLLEMGNIYQSSYEDIIERLKKQNAYLENTTIASKV